MNKKTNNYEEWIELVKNDVANGYCPYCENCECTEMLEEDLYTCTECGREIEL